MSESLRDLVVSLSLQTDNFTRNIKSVNKQIKEAESNFKLASAGVENFEQTASGLSSHLSTLERKLTLQRQAVTQYEQALQAANSKLSECYNRQNDYAKRLEQARAAQASLKEQVREAAAQVREYTRTLGESDAATENARGALDALKAEYLEAVQNVRKLAGQNTALQKSTLNAADAVTTARTNLNNASAAVRITETDIQKCNAALALAETNWEQATQAIKAGESALSGIGQQIRLAESNFTLAAASIENVETSVDGLSARMIMLEERYRLQTNAVTQYQNILESTKEQLEAAAAANDPAKVEEATRAVTEAQIALNHAQSAVEKTKLELEDCNQALALANTQWYSAGETFSKAETAIARIGQQIQLTESEFKLAVVGMKDIESSTDGLGKKADMLSTKWLHLMDVVSQSQKALNAAYDRLAAANEAGDSDLIEKAEADVVKARTALNNARAASEEAYFELQRCRNELDLFADGWYDAGDSIEKSKSALGAINKQLQQAQSRFKIASAGIKDIDKSTQGLSAKLTLLKEKFDLQKKALQQYEYALSAAQRRLEIAQSANDPEKIQKATDEVLEAETALIGATAALKETKAEIEACNRALKTTQSAWTAAGNSLESFSKTCDKVSKGMTTAGRTLTTVMTAPIIALGTAAVKASISYETAFTSVRKTVDATEAEFAQLSGEIKQMSTEVATSADDIAEVVAIAGQLGIANEYLTSFSKTMIDLGNSTDIVAEEAASTLAKFANITGMDQSQFSNLGATLVDLGNNYATTESAIMNMAMRLAAAGDQVGLSESQILGFAAALSSVGIEAEMGGSAFSKALIKMEVAAATGGQALEDFAMVSGMTADQFKALWDADPAGAFQAFIEGLAKMDDEGMSAIATLDEIGIAEIRLRDTLLRAVNANELFTETQITANKAWEENTALVEEAGKRYATTSSKLTNLKNKAVLFGQQIGDDLNPTIHELIDGADELLEKFMALDEAQRLQIIKFAAIAAASGPVLLGLGKISKGISVVTSGLSTFAKAVGKAGGGFKGFASVLAKSPAFWVAIAAAAVTATVAIVDFVSGARQAREALEGMNETAEKWKQTAADTFYSNSDGLSFFGLSESDFNRTEQTAAEWLSGLLSVWTDGQKETDQIVSDWTESFKALTGATREELEEMKATADAAGYIGHDKDVQIRQGKNLLGINYDVDLTNVTTRIMPTGEDKDGELLYLPELYIDSPYIDRYTQPKWMHLAVSDAKEVTKGDDKKTKNQCYKEMRKAAQDEFDAGCDLPTMTLKVEFVNCAETVEYAQYKALQNIYLGDSVRVIAKRIGVEVSMRMTQYTYDCLTRKYTAVTLGTVADTIEGNMISARQLASGIISGSKLAINSVGSGQLQSGSVGALQIQLAAIQSAHIETAAIISAHIANAAIQTAHIADAQITNAQIADATITAAKIAQATITAACIAKATITEAEIADAAITSAKIALATITEAHIAEAAINTAHIADLAVTAAKIANATITSAKIAQAAIQSAHIEDAAITKAKIALLAVDEARIADLAVGTAKVQDAAITNAKIADLAVTAAKIANATITNAQIANATIGTAQIALGAITTALIAQGAVGTAQIADASITDAKIVELSANRITTGTLSVERLIIVGSEKSIVYTINEANGTAQLSQTTIDGGSLTQRSITADRIVAGAITANEIAAATILANNIAAGAITAEKIAAGAVEASHIKAGAITSSHLAAEVGESLNLSSNKSINSKVETIYADMDNLIGYRMEIVSTSDILSSAIRQTTLSARVWHGSENVTDKIPAERFAWRRISADPTADALWAAANTGVKSIQLSVLDVQYSATYQCDLLNA